MATDKEETEGRIYGMELGVVADNKDPKGLGRIRVVIPGLIDEPSAWAPPIGNPGGGSLKRGLWFVPKEGADVAVFFHRGDRERPYYLPAHWGEPKAGKEVPTPVQDVPPADQHRIVALETERYLVTYDDRPDHETLRLEDKLAGDKLELDGTTLAITLQATTSVNIVAAGAVNIDGLNVTIAGRPVVPNGLPIQ